MTEVAGRIVRIRGSWLVKEAGFCKLRISQRSLIDAISEYAPAEWTVLHVAI